MACIADFRFALAGQLAEALVREAEHLQAQHAFMVVRQAILQDASFNLHQFRDLAQEPFVDRGDLMNFVHG